MGEDSTDEDADATGPVGLDEGFDPTSLDDVLGRLPMFTMYSDWTTTNYKYYIIFSEVALYVEYTVVPKSHPFSKYLARPAPGTR